MADYGENKRRGYEPGNGEGGGCDMSSPSPEQWTRAVMAPARPVTGAPALLLYEMAVASRTL